MLNESDSNMGSPFGGMRRIEGESFETSFPSKSKVRYEVVYQQFMEWKKSKNIQTITENDLINYMKELSSTMKPSTLWSRYSMLKSTLNVIEDFDISKFYRLRTLLKKLSEGYITKKSHTLTAEQMHKFIREAPDHDYLFTKVVLVFGINGGCSRSELKKLTMDNITDHNNELIVKIFENENKIDRMFVINGGYYGIVKKYMELRPPGLKPFFLSHLKGRLTHQPVGINKLGNQARIIAQYLKLENPEGFTGHCFRRTGQAILATGSGDSQIVQNTSRKKIYCNFNSELHENFQNNAPSKKDNSNRQLYFYNIFEDDLEKKSYEKALEDIGKDWMSDESQIFGNFVASELRDISNQELRRQLKLYIQKGILEFSEKDALLEESFQASSSNYRRFDNEETTHSSNNSPKS